MSFGGSWTQLMPIGLLSLLSVVGCAKGIGKASSASQNPFVLSGSVTYDWVPAKDNVTEGGVRLDFGAESQRPVRRALVQALDRGVEVALTTTDDLGRFTLNVPGGEVTIRVLARSSVTNYTSDSVAPDTCSGASWDVRVVNNVTNSSGSATDGSQRAQYTLDDSTVRKVSASSITLNAPLTWSGSYSNRAAAPFAILDTIVSQIETICQGSAAVSLPLLYVNWSSSNTNLSGNKYQGQITTSHYTIEGSANQANLYILGKEDVDTDEFDDHVIAHEFGHYLESKLFRSDSVGGSHSLGNMLDPRVAFGEGYGNAISGMVFNDPVYVDTSGTTQSGGFTINVATIPSSTNDRGIYSENSAQYFLWNLYENRDGTANSGSFDRIYDVMYNSQRTTAAYTSMLSFASYYNQTYTSTGDVFSTLWTTDLHQPLNALCSGACSGTGDTADPFDVDNDLGATYSSVGRVYSESTANTFTAPFWQLFRTLVDGTNTATAHDRTVWSSYSASLAVNKFGAIRWYRYTAGANSSVTVTVNNLGGGATCSQDVLDLFIHSSGTLLGSDVLETGATAGCPTVTFTATTGTVYTVSVRGYSTEVTSYDVIVTP